MDELPPTNVMHNLTKWAEANPSKLKITTFVEGQESVSSFVNRKLGKVTETDIRKALESDNSAKTLVLLCGPDPYVNAPTAEPRHPNDLIG